MKEWNADDASPEIITLEMSDGGEGMLDAFLSAMKGERVRIHAHDALMRWIEAEYGIVDDTATTEIYTLSLHDAPTIYSDAAIGCGAAAQAHDETAHAPAIG